MLSNGYLLYNLIFQLPDAVSILLSFLCVKLAPYNTEHRRPLPCQLFTQCLNIPRRNTFKALSTEDIFQYMKEGNVLFNDTLNTFYLQLYGVRHMVKDHSDSKRGNPLPPHGLLFTINSKGSFIYTIPQTG